MTYIAPVSQKESGCISGRITMG